MFGLFAICGSRHTVRLDRVRAHYGPSLNLDRAGEQLAVDGIPVTGDLLARLSPLQFDHIDFLGR
ncbi:hypothetical protein [Streptomyces olivochromogenes]|uniref:hypothetical protein n=1 Tax=Streptomyces olivochromogenes TaxID=1963 RepID=UPI0036A6F9BB